MSRMAIEEISLIGRSWWIEKSIGY